MQERIEGRSRIGHIAWLLLFCFFVLDQFLKWVVVRPPHDIPREFFYILSFGFFPNDRFFFSFSGTYFVFIILWWLLFLFVLGWIAVLWKKGNDCLIFALIMIFVGALSNGIDRWRFGFVVDYLLFLQNLSFNLADFFILGGGILLFRRSGPPRASLAKGGKM